MKIGLIQNEAVVGDLSHNLRLVVQGYRRCMDAGAELVIASAQALDGAFLQDLATRSSFRLQACAALAALAAETTRPLLLVSHAGEPGEAAEARPYLLCRGKVRRLRQRRVEKVCGMRVFLAVGEEPPAECPAGCDMLVYFPLAHWWPGQAEAWQEQLTHTAKHNGTSVLMLRGVGCTEGRLSPGGSLAVNAHGGSTRLPLFKAAAKVWSTSSTATANKAQDQGEALLQALCYGLKEMCRQRGDDGVAIPADAPRAALLLALARVALGARHTVALAGQPAPLCALAGKRMSGTAALASELRLSLVSPFSLNQILLGTEQTPCAGELAPLGEVYEGELPQLQRALSKRMPERLKALLPPCPEAAPDEQVLRLLVEENAAPAEILAHYPGADETKLRRQLRQWMAAAARRHCRPPALRIRRRLVHLPAHHRLSE